MSLKYILAALVFVAAGRSQAIHRAGEIRVRIYNYVSVAPHALENAEREAARMLGAAGIAMDWRDCEIPREERPAADPCSAPIMAPDFLLRIYNRAMARRVETRSGCVGFSLVSEGFDPIGAVFHHRAIELKRQLGIPLGSIPGAVIAHELGHLLLEEPGHAHAGLMSAHWNDHTLLRISRSQLGFSRAEIRRLKAQLMLRIGSIEGSADPQRAAANGN